jgi:hypothetical protein
MVNRGEKREVFIFLLDGDFLVHRKSIGVYTGEIKPQNGMNIKGDSVVTLIRENHVEVYVSNGSGFLRRQSFDAPERVLRYDAALESFGLLAAGTGEGITETLYGVKNAGMNAPLFEKLSVFAGGDKTALFFENADGISLAGKKADGWYVVSFDSRGTVSGEERLDGIGTGEKLFAYGARDSFHLYFFDPGRLVITICEKQDANWCVLDRVGLPAEIPAAGADWDGWPAGHSLFREDRLIPVNAKGGTLVFETAPGRISLLENDALHASRNINGIMYCAVHDDGEIALFRIEEAD